MKKRLNMETIIYIILSLIMGIMISIYLPMNSSVSRYIGSPITANITFFLVALITAIIIFMTFGDIKTIRNVNNVPIYLYLTGFISAFIVLGTTFLIPKIGARKFFIFLIAGQIIMSMILSHFALLESPKDPITIKKVIGALLLVIGTIISVN